MAITSIILFHFLASWSCSCLLSLVIAAGSFSSKDFDPLLPTPPPVFLFGDSTLDVGTNNYLPNCEAIANHHPYGIDLIPKPSATGRWSNGLNTADIILKLMGHQHSPLPYLHLNKMDSFRERVDHGVNFASAGSGLLDTTGARSYNQVVSMGKQIEQFSEISQLFDTVEESALFFSKSIFLISIGSNDLFDYKHYNYTIGGEVLTGLAFAIKIRETYANHIKSLYKLGARKFAIISIPPLGCCPYVRAINNGECMIDANMFAETFFTDMKTWFAALLLELPEMKYSLGNAYAMTMKIILNPKTFDISNEKGACCGHGTFNAKDQCGPGSNLCENRNEYLFWDRFHPTEFISDYAARTLYAGDIEVVYPYNFKHLIGL